jgi:hypothetical protein
VDTARLAAALTPRIEARIVDDPFDGTLYETWSRRRVNCRCS